MTSFSPPFPNPELPWGPAPAHPFRSPRATAAHTPWGSTWPQTSRCVKSLPAASLASALTLALAALFTSGCSQPQPTPGVNLADGPAVFGRAPGGSATTQPDDSSWTIVLATIKGDFRERDARAALARIAASNIVPSPTLRREGEVIFVVSGRYQGPTDTNAIAELQRLRSHREGNQQPFASALLAPPARRTELGANPDFNLLAVRQNAPADMRYTLQVGAYAPGDQLNPTSDQLAESRSAAERAAAQLRAEGEQAFYYHGPTMSVVTVGLFTDRDLTDGSPALVALRRKFPHNLFNGQGIAQRRPGQTTPTLQPSSLVLIPSN